MAQHFELALPGRLPGRNATTQGTDRRDSLDLLRGLLAVGVASYHVAGWTNLANLWGLGSYGVYMFFVLSGFALTWTYGSREFGLWTYAVARISRIMPLYVAATIASTIGALPHHVAPGRLLANLLLVFPLTHHEDIPIGGWSIGVELSAYLMLPFLFVCLISRIAVICALTVSLGLRLFVVQATIVPGEDPRPNYHSLGSFLFFFVAGLAIARLLRARPDLVGKSPFIFTAFGLAIFGAVPLLWPRDAIAGPSGLAMTVASVALVAATAASNLGSSFMRAVAGLLGNASYGIYLLHPLVFLGVRKLALPPALTLVLTVTASVPCGWASWRYFERPVGKRLRRRLARPIDRRELSAATG